MVPNSDGPDSIPFGVLICAGRLLKSFKLFCVAGGSEPIGLMLDWRNPWPNRSLPCDVFCIFHSILIDSPIVPHFGDARTPVFPN